MKNKKSKIIIPAMGLILLSTAASISGSVAWFTANRTATVTAGEFSVVKTGEDLSLELAAGLGTTADDDTDVQPNTHTVTVAEVSSGVPYTQTDSSFNHLGYDKFVYGGDEIADPGVTETGLKVLNNNGELVDATYADNKLSATAYSDTSADYTFYKARPSIIVPDSSRANVLHSIGVQSATLENLGRETGVLSAFTWTMTFTVNFSASSTKDIGLFFDTSAAETWCRKKLVITAPRNALPEEYGTYYANADLTGDQTVISAEEGHNTFAAGTYYKAEPVSSGKGFRIAFVPTAVDTDSMGYTKVWAPHQNNAGSKYVTTLDGQAIESTTYSNSTYSFDGTDYETVAAPALIYNGLSLGVPADNSTDADTSLSSSANYLGFFNAPASGGNVSMTFTCVAWYEGTDANVENDDILETVYTSMKFGVSNFNA